jgi:hypothetical protein
MAALSLQEDITVILCRVLRGARKNERRGLRYARILWDVNTGNAALASADH